MQSRVIRTPARLILWLMVVSLVFVTCSDDSECPTCPTCPTLTQWVYYDNFDNNTLNSDLWSTTIHYGGQVLETAGQLQVWGHTDYWTGAGIVIAIQPKLAWRFDLVDTYFEEGAGCQGWHIAVRDSAGTTGVEVLNRATAGCTNPPDMGDATGRYEIRHEGDSLAVYGDDSLLRRVHDHGISSFVIRFESNNVWGDGAHCRVFIDNVWGLELAP